MRLRTLLTPVVAQLEEPIMNTLRAATYLAVTLVVAACAGGTPSAPASSPTAPGSTPTATKAGPSASPTSFTSKTYGYSLTVPAGWTVMQASAAWDGKGAPFHDVPEADQFVGPAAASAWFFGAPTTKDLKAKVNESIAANAASHGNTCPAVPDVQDPIQIGSEPGVLLGYNCGILINSGITVHKGIAYLFGFRDPAVHAATDPADRAAFLELLKSVQFPD
ncbi:MAG: hypothetical protein QOF11_2284 [Chloroflexota bacterium]|jgi:hypothetical protein|nr:hypothetical protein [Chloroflexota bacterium]